MQQVCSILQLQQTHQWFTEGIAISIAALQGLQHEACVNIVCLGSIENCDGLYLTKGCLHALLQRHNKLYIDYADYVSCTARSKH